MDEYELTEQDWDTLLEVAFTPAHSPSWWERAWLLLNKLEVNR